MPAKADGFALVASLYRQILRAHRVKLPGPLRALGDSYVRHEFSSHLKAKTTKQQWEAFGREWQTYNDMLRGKGDVGMAATTRTGDIAPDVLADMSADQRQRLKELEEEMHSLGKPKPE